MSWSQPDDPWEVSGAWPTAADERIFFGVSATVGSWSGLIWILSWALWKRSIASVMILAWSASSAQNQ